MKNASAFRGCAAEQAPSAARDLHCEYNGLGQSLLKRAHPELWDLKAEAYAPVRAADPPSESSFARPKHYTEGDLDRAKAALADARSGKTGPIISSYATPEAIRSMSAAHVRAAADLVSEIEVVLARKERQQELRMEADRKIAELHTRALTDASWCQDTDALLAEPARAQQPAPVEPMTADEVLTEPSRE